MKFIRIFFLIISILSTISCEKSELLSVTVLFRHGSRAPRYMVKTDPYNSKVKEIWPNGLSQLTNLGKNQQYALGQWYREYYKDFIPEKYDQNIIRVMSSNKDRCLMSVAANLAGLFPPKDEQIWNPNLLWQPIPIHTQPEKKDVIIVNDNCDKFAKKYKEFLQSDYFLKYDQDNKELYNYLSEHSGQDVRDLENVTRLHDSLYIESYYNLSLPEWTKQVFPHKTFPLLIKIYTTKTNTTELARLKLGGLIDYITTFFEEYLEDPNNSQKFLMLSVHDSTLAQLLNTLQVYDYTWPEYASTLIFELRKKAENIFLNINFKNSTTFRNIQLNGCQFDCPFEQYKDIIKPVRIKVKELEKECLNV